MRQNLKQQDWCGGVSPREKRGCACCQKYQSILERWWKGLKKYLKRYECYLLRYKQVAQEGHEGCFSKTPDCNESAPVLIVVIVYMNGITSYGRCSRQPQPTRSTHSEHNIQRAESRKRRLVFRHHRLRRWRTNICSPDLSFYATPYFPVTI